MFKKDVLIPVLICFIIYFPALRQLYFVIRGKEINIIKEVKKTILILLLSCVGVCCFFLVLNTINFLDYRKPISYEKVDSISFNDFVGYEFFREELYGSERFAYVYVTIDAEINDDNVVVESFFHPSRSYVYNKKIKSDLLFTHEIYHFKIAELFARKIRRDITNLSVKEETKIEEILKKYRSEERNYQILYDKETFHSYVMQKQIKYQKEVDSLLYLLKKFEQPKIKK